MKKDGTTVPSSDISWNNKKWLNLGLSTEDHSAINRRNIDSKSEKIINDVNAISISIKSEYLSYQGISIIPFPALTVFNEHTNVVNTVKDVNKKYSFSCTTDPVKLLKDTSLNKLCYSLTSTGSISAVVKPEDMHTNNCRSIITDWLIDCLLVTIKDYFKAKFSYKNVKLVKTFKCSIATNKREKKKRNPYHLKYNLQQNKLTEAIDAIS